MGTPPILRSEEGKVDLQSQQVIIIKMVIMAAFDIMVIMVVIVRIIMAVIDVMVIGSL